MGAIIYALCRHYGPPSLFITFTTNPNWPEIRSRLRPGQTAADIPFTIVRVFYAKLKLLKTWPWQFFGKIIYMVGVTEF